MHGPAPHAPFIGVPLLQRTAGAVGHAAVQIAVAPGASVLAGADSPAKRGRISQKVKASARWSS